MPNGENRPSVNEGTPNAQTRQETRRAHRLPPSGGSSGFTILELMVVLTLIVILATLAVPTYHVAIVHAREAVLRDDLYTLRKLIDEYTIDKHQPPAALDDLVDAGYLRGGLPVDPMTNRSDTWQPDIEDQPSGGAEATPGIIDVHSGSDQMALDGTSYNTW